MNFLRKKVEAGQTVCGLWICAGWGESGEIAAGLGLDYVIFDFEHGSGSIKDAINTMRALKGSETECVIRIPSSHPSHIKQALDVGARSLMIPMVETGEEAQAIVDYSVYPPNGKRGHATGSIRASCYGINEDYQKQIDDDLFLIPQIETRTGVKNAAAIAAIEGVSMIFIGPSDLSGAYGEVGDFQNSEYLQAVAQVEAAAKKAGKPLGTIASAPRPPAQLRAEGYSLLAGASDLILLRMAMKQAMEDMRA